MPAAPSMAKMETMTLSAAWWDITIAVQSPPAMATGRADGGDGTGDDVGALVGYNAASSTITASYATGNVNGGDGNE